MRIATRAVWSATSHSPIGDARAPVAMIESQSPRKKRSIYFSHRQRVDRPNPRGRRKEVAGSPAGRYSRRLKASPHVGDATRCRIRVQPSLISAQAGKSRIECQIDMDDRVRDDLFRPAASTWTTLRCRPWRTKPSHFHWSVASSAGEGDLPGALPPPVNAVARGRSGGTAIGRAANCMLWNHHV